MDLDMEVQRRRDLKEFIQSQGLCVETDTSPKTLAEAAKYPFGVRNCPECQFELDFDGTYSRAAQEECGHIKCRSCVIHSMAKGEYCRQCAHGMRTRPALWVKLINYRDRTGNEETSHSRNRNEKEIESPPHSYTPATATATYTNRNRKSSPMLNSTNNNYYNNVHKPFVFYPSMQMSKNTTPETETETETETTPRLGRRDPDFSPMLWNPLSVRKIKESIATATAFSSPSYAKASAALGRAPDSIFSGRVNPEMLNTNSFTNLHAISLTRKTPIMTPPEPKQSWDVITISNSESGSESDKSEPNFACADCGKSFSSRWILDLHSGTHSAKECGGDSRPYKFRCNKCPSVFQDTIELCRHLALHYSVERPFQCSLCGTVFKSQKNLRHHVRHLHKYDNNLGNYSQIQNYRPTEERNRRRALKNIMPNNKLHHHYQNQLQTVREFFSPEGTETATSSSRPPVIKNTVLPLPAFTSTTPTIATTTTTTLSTSYRRSPYYYHRQEIQPPETDTNQLHVSSLFQVQSKSFNNNKETYNNNKNNNNSNYDDNNRHSSTILTSTSTSIIKTPTQSKSIQNPMLKPSATAASNTNPIDLSLYSKFQRNSSFEFFPNKKIKYATFTDVETETGSGIKLGNGEPICNQNSHLNLVPKLNLSSNGNSMTFSTFHSNANSTTVKNGSDITKDQASHPYPSHQFRNFNSAMKLFGGFKNKRTFENTDSAEVITFPTQLHPKFSHISDADMDCDCDPHQSPGLGAAPDPESNTLKPGTNAKIDAYNNINADTERGRPKPEPEAVDSDSDIMEIEESFDPQSSSGSDSTPTPASNPNPKPEMQHEVVENTELINPGLLECGRRGGYTDSFQGVTVVHEENGTTHIVF